MTASAERPVTVTKHRWETSPARLTRFEAIVIDEDDAGVWLRTEPLTIHRDDRGDVVYIATHTWLSLVPRGEMWFAMFAGANWKVDVCLPPVISSDAIEFCDLELDVMLTTHPDRRDLRIVDQDEFDALGLPPALAADCVLAAEHVRDLIATSAAPFDRRLDERIDAVIGADPHVAAGPLVRHGWIAPPFPRVHDQLRTRFGWTVGPDGGDSSVRTVLGGAFGEVHVLVVDGEVVGTHADRDTPPGLDTLVELTLEASRRLAVVADRENLQSAATGIGTASTT